MNLLMAGMVPTMMILQMQLGRGAVPTTAAFWFVMSMALLVGFIAAYPMNWWLVRYNLKHGMMTVRPAAAPVTAVASHTPLWPRRRTRSRAFVRGHGLRVLQSAIGKKRITDRRVNAMLVTPRSRSKTRR